MLALVVVLFFANLVSVLREMSAKSAAQKALDMAASIDHLRFQMMQNRLALEGYVLTGSPDPLNQFRSGMDTFEKDLADARGKAYSDGQRTALMQLEQRNKNWYNDFATPLLDKGKQVELGNADGAAIQLAYISAKNSWDKEPQPDESIDAAAKDNQREL